MKDAKKTKKSTKADNRYNLAVFMIYFPFFLEAYV
jgi:hypothetical protein